LPAPTTPAQPEALLPPPTPPVFTTAADTRLDVTGTQLVGESAASGASVVLARVALHGQVTLAPDGSFSYQPATGFVGSDSFWIAMSRGSVLSSSVEVVIEVLRPAASPSPMVAAPAPSPSGDAFAIGGTSDGGFSGPSVSFGSLGPLDFAFDWLIPGFIVTLPGLLVVLAVLAQVLVGTGWLPLVRREIGDFGVRRRRRTRTSAG
jgi:hypothetical protein